MATDPFALARPLLHRLDPETAHELTLRALEANVVPPQPPVRDRALETRLFGRALPGPLGLAAGFDKSARVFDRMFALGFDFVEIGGVTPLPQKGNPRPRVFRLPADRAVINSMGFPNDGADAVLRRVTARTGAGMLGVNLASNAASADPAADFVALAQRFAPYADYLTLDISCPNTENGQLLLDPARLRDLLERLAAVDLGAHRPALALKLSPDCDDERTVRLLDVALDAKIDGFVIANTTTQRPALRGDGARPGGLSGKPLFAASTELVRKVYAYTSGRVPIVGVGGIAGGADAYAKLRAGASALQLYTALIYEGPALLATIKRELIVYLLRDGYAQIADAVGTAHPRRIPA